MLTLAAASTNNTIKLTAYVVRVGGEEDVVGSPVTIAPCAGVEGALVHSVGGECGLVPDTDCLASLSSTAVVVTS